MIKAGIAVQQFLLEMVQRVKTPFNPLTSKQWGAFHFFISTLLDQEIHAHMGWMKCNQIFQAFSKRGNHILPNQREARPSFSTFRLD
tara:strand:+ start:63 stop:323 length:261 start_codon:yes stop_codon:yes gene_type:complete